MKGSGNRVWFSRVFRILAVVAVLSLGSCEFPWLRIDARISDFLDDLENEAYGDDIARHFHSDVKTKVNTESEWAESGFRSNEAESYSWNERDRSEVEDFSGTTKVSGTLTISLRDVPDDTATIDFYMKTEDGDWKIRAIDDDPSEDGVFIESLPRPLYEP